MRDPPKEQHLQYTLRIKIKLVQFFRNTYVATNLLSKARVKLNKLISKIKYYSIT